MKNSRPAHIPIHRARRAERNGSMEEDRKAIMQMIGTIKHRTILRMLREIVCWLTDHQDELI